MYCATVITTLSLLACVNSQLLEIPEMDDMISAAMRPFEQYTAFDAPTETASIAAPVESDAPVAQDVIVEAAAAAAAADTGYWLADIAHQGKAAFNSNPSGYTVFRNVKDYGAKGEHPMVMIPSSYAGH
jgi:glucan 1,3-beta-glucosidase